MNKAHEERENANKEFEKMLEKYDRWVLVKRKGKKERNGDSLYMFGRTVVFIRCICLDEQSTERGVSAAKSNRGDGGGQR